MIVTGSLDELFSVRRCASAAAQASAGKVEGEGQGSGNPWLGDARRLMKINDANHFSELASPSLSRCVVQWVSGSLGFASGPVPGGWLTVLTAAVLAATGAGLAAAAWITALGARRLLGESSSPPRPCRVRRLALFAVCLAAAAPLAGVLARWAEIGPAYFAGPSLCLLAVVALPAWLAGRSGGATPHPRTSLRPLVSGLLALLALIVGLVWLGVPWGMTWLSLLPTPRRALLGLALLPLLVPGCLALAGGMEALLGETERRWQGGLRRGLVWCAIPVVLWYAHRWVSFGAHPLFIVPITLVGLSFALPLPLWLLPNRTGMTLARALSHAGSAAWLLACHLPFVHGGPS
jgi:hypothetical protein